MVFMSLRQQSASIQALMELSKSESDQHQVSKQMLKYAASITSESIVLVEGEVKAPFEEVKSASVKDAEVVIRKVGSKTVVPPPVERLLTLASLRSTPSSRPPRLSLCSTRTRLVLLPTSRRRTRPLPT